MINTTLYSFHKCVLIKFTLWINNYYILMKFSYIVWSVSGKYYEKIKLLSKNHKYAYASKHVIIVKIVTQ